MSSTLRTPRTRHCCIVVILPAARELRVRASAERSRRRSLALPVSAPATRSQAARSNRGPILNAVAVCPALRPRRRLLAIGDRNLASLDRPPSRMGPRPFPTLPAEVGDGQILRLDRDVWWWSSESPGYSSGFICPRDESTGPTALAVTGPTPCRPNKKPGGQKLAPPFR